MKSRITKFICTMLALSFVCLFISSCGSKSSPAYVLEAGQDNGLVASYRAYFELDGTSIAEVREIRFNNLLEGSVEYAEISHNTYNFDAFAQSSNASDWQYTQNPNDKAAYDVSKLIKYLKKMGATYTGNIHIQVTEFDEYTAIEVQNIKDNTIGDISTALFRRNTKINFPSGLSLQSLWKVYKRQ